MGERWVCPQGRHGWFLPTRTMTSNLLAPAQWAQTEFALARLGDQRRTQRLVKMAGSLAQTPTGTLPQAFPAWKDLKAAYRLLDHLEFGPEQLQEPHRQRTLEACQQSGEYLFIEDTTDLDYSSRRRTGHLGPIGNHRGRGLRLQSTLAVRVEAWGLGQKPEGVAVGLLDQQIWARRSDRGTGGWRQRLRRPREFDRWARVLEQTGGPPAQCQWTYLADREADFYEPIQRCQRAGVDFIIRAYRDRRLAGEGEHLLARLKAQTVGAQWEVAVRGRNGEVNRQALVSVRSCPVTLQGPWRPHGQQPDLPVNVVEVREEAPPSQTEPLHWILLTSLPCEKVAQWQRIIGRYQTRWWIEHYHKALKSGAGVEESQLEQGFRIENLVAVLAVLAVRLVNTQWLARHRPDDPVQARSFGESALEILSAKFQAPTAGWTNQTVLIAVARLGGFLARKHDGLPGWQTIWRGWYKLLAMCEALEILREKEKKCG